MAKDPVCGMQVNEQNAAAKGDWKGRSDESSPPFDTPRGSFHQRVDATGWQREEYGKTDITTLRAQLL